MTWVDNFGNVYDEEPPRHRAQRERQRTVALIVGAIILALWLLNPAPRATPQDVRDYDNGGGAQCYDPPTCMVHD